MKACKAEAKSGEQKRQEKKALHTATHKAAVIQAVHKLDHKDGDVSSLTTRQIEAIAHEQNIGSLGCIHKDVIF